MLGIAWKMSCNEQTAGRQLSRRASAQTHTTAPQPMSFPRHFLNAVLSMQTALITHGCATPPASCCALRSGDDACLLEHKKMEVPLAQQAPLQILLTILCLHVWKAVALNRGHSFYMGQLFLQCWQLLLNVIPASKHESHGAWLLHRHLAFYVKIDWRCVNRHSKAQHCALC